MNELTVFNNEEFGSIRTITINEEPWFVGKDVAVALGYTNPQKAIRDHIDEYDRGVNKMFTPGGEQDVAIINESGLYSLILSSKLPSTKRFKRWVTSEVLPTIRKTGEYKIQEKKRATDIREQNAKARLNNSRAKVSSMWLKIAEIASTQESKDICAHYAAAELAGKEVLPLPESKEKYYTAAEVGELLGGISPNAVGRIANQNGLKTPDYGIMVWDKAKNANKQVQSWRYNQAAIDKMKTLI